MYKNDMYFIKQLEEMEIILDGYVRIHVDNVSIEDMTIRMVDGSDRLPNGHFVTKYRYLPISDLIMMMKEIGVLPDGKHIMSDILIQFPTLYQIFSLIAENSDVSPDLIQKPEIQQWINHYIVELEEMGVIKDGQVVPFLEAIRTPVPDFSYFLWEIYDLPETDRDQILDGLINQYPPLYRVLSFVAIDAFVDPQVIKKPKSRFWEDLMFYMGISKGS